jgi:hypothetical protein
MEVTVGKNKHSEIHTSVQNPQGGKTPDDEETYEDPRE